MKTTIVIEHEGPIDLTSDDDRSQKMILKNYFQKLTCGAASAKVMVSNEGMDVPRVDEVAEKAKEERAAAKAARKGKREEKAEKKPTVVEKVKKAVVKKKK